MKTSNNIYLIEDDRGTCYLISKALQKEGYQVTPYYSGSEFLNDVNTKSQGIILLDYWLPDTNAEHIIQELKARNINLPFIVMTGPNNEKIAIRMMEMGAFDYLLKSLNFIELVPIVLKKLKGMMKASNGKDTEKVYSALEKKSKGDKGNLACAINNNSEITSCDDNYSSYFQKDACEIIGHKCYCLVHNEDNIINDCPLDRMKKTGKRESLITTIKDQLAEITVTPIFDSHGEIRDAQHVISFIEADKRVKRSYSKERELKRIRESWNAAFTDSMREILLIKNSVDVMFLIFNSLNRIKKDAPMYLELINYPLEGKSNFYGSEQLKLIMSEKLPDTNVISNEACILNSDHFHEGNWTGKTETSKQNVLYIPICRNERKIGEVVIMSGKRRFKSEDIEMAHKFEAVFSVALQKIGFLDELKDTKNRVRLISENMSEAFVEIDEKGKIMQCNLKFAAYFDMNPEEIINTHITSLILDHSPKVDSNQMLKTKLDEVFALKSSNTKIKMEDFIFEICNKMWKLRFLEIIILENGTSKNSRSYIIRDITERQLSRNLIKELNERITEKNEEMQKLVYITSHDLRSPLVNISGFMMEIEKEIDKTMRTWVGAESQEVIKNASESCRKIRRYFDFIKTSVTKIEVLVEGLLKLSRLEQTKSSIDKIDMNKLMTSVINGVRYSLEKHDIHIYREDLLPCYGDLNLLNQLFSNLIDNAIKYHDPKKEKNTVHIGSKKSQSDYITYIVQDNGIGIANNLIQYVFDVFYKANRESPGDGLGLSVVQKICKRMNGDIHVESIEGEGTTFKVDLMRQKWNLG